MSLCLLHVLVSVTCPSVTGASTCNICNSSCKTPTSTYDILPSTCVGVHSTCWRYNYNILCTRHDITYNPRTSLEKDVLIYVTNGVALLIDAIQHKTFPILHLTIAFILVTYVLEHGTDALVDKIDIIVHMLDALVHETLT